jgi:hypothetical protein
MVGYSWAAELSLSFKGYRPLEAAFGADAFLRGCADFFAAFPVTVRFAAGPPDVLGPIAASIDCARLMTALISVAFNRSSLACRLPKARPMPTATF